MPPESTTPSGSSGPSRRVVLAAAAGGAAALAGGVWLGGRFRGGGEPGSGAPSELPSPVSASTLPEGVEVGLDGVSPFRVPNEDFFQIDTAFGLPKVDAATWSLRIHGMVEREVTLDYATLLAGDLIERDITISCVSNSVGGDLLGNAAWLGLPIAPLLARAGPVPDADMVLSTSEDGWTASTPLNVLADTGRDCLLAVGMNGAVLPARHGFPVRMVVPGLYGFVSATKWVVDLEVTRFDLKSAYWTTRGWSPRGPVKLASRVDVPRDGARVAAGPVGVGGVAWAPHVGIEGVEVRVDGGPWQSAELAASGGIDAWRQWAFTWQATSGRHELAVRATDRGGQVQTGERADVIPDGATGWHTIIVQVD